MILEFKKYVSDTFVDEIRQQVLPFVEKVNKETTYNRDGLTVSISTIPDLSVLDGKISNLLSEFQNKTLEQRFKPKFLSGDSGYEYHLYRPGDVCHYHSDGEFCISQNNNTSLLRYATVILFLTDNEDGELVFPSQNVEIKPEKGKIVAFPPYGFFGHYSKPSVKNREILMTWFVYNGIEVRKQNAT